MHLLTWLKDKGLVVAVRHFNSAKDQPFTWRAQYLNYSCSTAGEQTSHEAEPEAKLKQ
jgi:hypothetical protein